MPLREAITSVNSAELGITGLRPKKANGSLLFEVENPDGSEKADALVTKISQVFSDVTGIRFTLPLKFGEVRVRDR